MGVRGAVVLGVVVAACACSERVLEGPRDAGGGDLAHSPMDAGRDASGPTDGGLDLSGPSPDGGADASGDRGPGTVTVNLRSREIGPLLGTPDTIAADEAGVYWLTHDNELWIVDETAAEAAAVPRRLASDGAPSIICDGYGRLAVADDQLFWVAEWFGPQFMANGALHRTTKAGEDVVLVNNVAISDPVDIVVHDDDIYWNEGISSGGPPPRTFVRTLPRNAAPGANPIQLVTVDGFYQVTSTAIIGSDLYWTTVYQGTTVFKPSLQRADLASLRQGPSPTPSYVASAWKVRGHDGNLFLGQSGFHDLTLTRMPATLGASTSLAVFTDSAIGEIEFLDRWALTSVWSGGCGSIRYTLLAVPTDAAGGPIVQLAADLVTPAVLGRELAFVDAAQMLHLVAVDDVRAALTAVPPSLQ